MKIYKVLRYLVYFLQFLFLAIVILPFRLLPFRFASFLFGNFFGGVLYIAPVARRRIIKNLNLIYPLMDEVMKYRFCKDICVNCSRLLIETIFFMTRSFKKMSKYVEIQNGDELVEMQEKYGKVIILTSHIGNWWFITKYIKSIGIEMHSIYKKTNNPFTSFWVKAGGVRLIEKGENVLSKMLKVLKNDKVAVSTFQDYRENRGIRLNLLGKPAMTSTIMAKIGIKYKIPIIYISCVRGKQNKTKFTMNSKVVYTPEDENEYTEETLTQFANDVISADIDNNKEQWFWLHNRWK